MTAQSMLLLACLALLPAAAQDPDKAAAPAGPMKVGSEALEKLAWIPGTWVVEGKRTTEEHWRPLQGNTLIGTSHMYEEKKTHFFEFLRITAMNGTLAYIALPANAQQPTVFLLAKLEDNAVVFENAKHDHPQRIRYEKTAVGVTATISQMDGSKAQSFAFKKK
jgi:hypothetical protein